MNIKVIIIRTDFEHHGEDFGYKQLLKYISPYKVFGLNERDLDTNISIYKKKHQWLFEFEAFFKKGNADLLHIFYGEDYFRWSAFLFKKIPIIVTFHQPAELLELELKYGNYRGRVARLMHLINKGRLKKIAAAIVTSEAQKIVLSNFMDSKKIHVLPLGVHIDVLKNKFEIKKSLMAQSDSRSKYVITIGNWLRDWEFYFKVVENSKEMNFYLVNQRLEYKYKSKINKYPNLKYFENISDEEMFDLIISATVQFIPITGIAASNALIQGLALGCPLVLTDVNSEEFQRNENIILLYKRGSIDNCKEKLEYFLNLSNSEIDLRRKLCQEFSLKYSWEEIANRTKEIYSQVLNT